jgi:hypothetical protein
MQLKLFIVPVKNLSIPENEMNAFLRSHRVLAVRKEFVSDGENSFWTFCVEYLESVPMGQVPPGSKLPKVNYKEVLKPEEFEVFSRLEHHRNNSSCSCQVSGRFAAFALQKDRQENSQRSASTRLQPLVLGMTPAGNSPAN